MAGSSQRYTDLLPRTAHSAIICGQTGCGKTVFILDLLAGPYRGVFRHIVILCPTIRHNKTYLTRPWIWTDPEVYVLDPGERLHDYLRAFHHLFQGEPTLFIIDDCSATKALTKKKDMLSELAFSGRHAEQSVWVSTQKYNAVSKDLREQTRWVCLFHCKDRDSFEDCLRENDAIPTREDRAFVRQRLAETKHAKLLLKTDQPVAYSLHSNC
ncbi:MAG: ATP-binding protein [Candidatus Thiodiazotropha sp. (ex Notomyrtea botanica)]|nr:ATP-binding protein [Candidatus Thiodiazotropha sp. (ex Notomyrtea botanica)]